MDKREEQRNQEEASEDEDPDTGNQRTTKQLIKQGILDLYEEYIQHEDQLESEKQEEQEQDAHGKMAALHIREATLGRLCQKSCKMVGKEQSTSSSSSVCNEGTADATTDATTEVGDNTSGCSNYDIIDGAVQESPLIRTKKGPSPTNVPSSNSSKKQQSASASDVDMIVNNVVRNSSCRQECMMYLQEKKWNTRINMKNVNGWQKRIAKRKWI